jgi:hypothetical protein
MKTVDDAAMAEAVGRRVLGWKGPDLLEFIYLLEEKNTIELLRQFVSLNDDKQNKVLDLCRRANESRSTALRGMI